MLLCGAHIYLRDTPTAPYRLIGLRLDGGYRAFDTNKNADLSGAVFDNIIARNLGRHGLRVWKIDGIRFGRMEVHHRDKPLAGTDVPKGRLAGLRRSNMLLRQRSLPNKCRILTLELNEKPGAPSKGALVD